ncbi:methyl-accepting chemotaxis protein (plasmid) [Ralstonia solanacearum P673]|uniref:methyl-accepting chemotaxis protein n=1 Tax=Ralstonia solanacearum TaxID=305 RepID=UPI002029C5DB|nr:methyl-accepting chemotaxis protein [Ralstonia solanacearum]MCL9852134.1 methyl-accepting chemotaxis protein [Ralstonia solanacearum]MCL9853821.1 methyl-accepting chemotaxis protein [Ralstonia solanacearum]MCL9859612.1 methyl-accepting chemotaxis protein [Ralstonia solanacearum]MCL9862824.1 methyl-accepting chemotaxis protein [Ralstonia solanacearum]MCL9870169.1 methyl-accepting chemotaxis protein [Ralstonia solanacearum]
MFRGMTIRLRLALMMVGIGALAVIVGTTGLIGMRHANTRVQDTYAVQLAGAVALADSDSNLLSFRIVLDRAAMSLTAPDMDKTVERARMFLARSDASWKRYRALPSTPDERKLADEADALRSVFLRDGAQALMQAIEAGDAARTSKTVMDAMPALYRPLGDKVAALSRMQMEIARASYEAGQREHDGLSVLTTALLLGGIVGGGLLTWALRRSITVPLNRAIEQAEHITRGDLTHAIHVDRTDETGRLLQALQRMQDGLQRMVGQVRAGSDSIAGATQQIAAGNADLSQRTEQQASSLEETASSMAQLTGMVKQNADHARQASSLAVNASDVAVKGGEVVGRVVETMAGINDSSKKIADIIGVIEGIAFQTNILALNAAVEAARAGEQGRGFAAVAGEVRSLAQRSAGAAKEIKALISDSVGRVENGTTLVAEAGTVIDEVVVAVKRVTGIMGEISAASEAQSTGIAQVNLAVAQMDEVTQQNAALVEQAAAAAMSLQEQADGLRGTVAAFRTRADAPAAAVTQPRRPVAAVAKAPARVDSRAQQSVRKAAVVLPGTASKAASPSSAAAVSNTRQAAAEAVAQAPKKPVPKLVAAGGGESDWETF